MEVKFYGSQNNRATVAPLAYTGSPWKLFISDILLFLQWSPYLINIVLPLWPCPSRCLDELYPSLANIHDILLHTILVVAQSSFLVSLPFLITIPFVFYIFYIGLFLALNMSVCNLLNGKIPEEGLKSTEDEHSEAWKRHDDESWIFLNGVAVGKHWLQSNIDRISRTFHRPVVGVHNRTNGIIFDVIECLIQRALLYSNSDIRQCHMLIKKALYAPGIKKVVLILHSQGGIEGGMILDWLYDEVPHDLLKQLEVYTFGNAANHFNNPYRVNIPGVGAGVGSKHTSAYLQTQNKRAVAHIEHYANRKDFVSRWGVLHFTRKVSEDPLQNRFMGRVFERPGGGHQFNQHYLDNMFPLDPTGRFVRGLADGDFMEMDVWVGGDTEAREGLGQSLEATSGSIEPESRVLSSSPSSVWTESQEQTSRPQGNFMISVVDELARTNGVPLKALKVKNLSRLWAYCNGDSPTDIITEAVIKEPAENKGGERPVTDLPDPGEGITITEEILKAARNEHTGERLVTVLLDRRRDEISITEEVIKAVAANRRSATKLMTLILESDVKFSDEYHWAREVGIVGYSSQEIADLLLEDLHDSPWIFFEPTYVDHGKFEANRHIPECCHHCLAHPPGPTQFIEYQSTTVDHEDIIEEIQELCGLAGISPTTRNVTDWIGSIEFGAGNHVGAVSFTLPCDGNNLLDTQIIYTRISQALKRLCQAIALTQSNHLCCDSFTVLKSGCHSHESSGISRGEVVSVAFGLVKNLDDALSLGLETKPEESTVEKLLLTSKAILGLVWPDLTEIEVDSSIQYCLHLCALAVQFLCLGFFSYSQAHIGPFQPFFLDGPVQQVVLMGLKREEPFFHLIAELVDPTCLRGMTRGPVLVFRASQLSGHDRDSEEPQSPRLSRKCDILGRVEDILDTWGPGNLVFPRNERSSPVAIQIGDGFIFAGESESLHWAHGVPDAKELSHIDLAQPLLIGTLITENAACGLSEAVCRGISSNILEELGTTRAWWRETERQTSISGGQYVFIQCGTTWDKQTGISVKDRAFVYPDEDVLIQKMDSYWGVQLSYCTGVARRVRLRRLVADLMPHFSYDSSLKTNTVESKLRNKLLGPGEVRKWLGELSSDLRVEFLQITRKILDTLRHTGLDSTGKYFCVAWPFKGDITGCLKIPLEDDSSWARVLADSHDCATFAYITMECFETAEIQCSKTRQACQDIYLLETAIFRPRRENYRAFLQHNEICFFSKQDSMFWVKVLKEHTDQPAHLVELLALLSMPMTIRQRLYLSEKRKQRSRLRECHANWAQGEVVSVSSAGV